MENNLPIATSQTVRFRDTTAQIQTIVLNGIVCLRLQDVQRRFPSVTNLCIDNIQLSFLSDEDGNDLKPLRIAACTDKVVEALEPIGQHNDALADRLDRISSDMQEVRKTNELILANTQETLCRLKHVMTQMYELQEFTTPRYFVILPGKHHEFELVNDVKNLFILRLKLYFLCECSDEPEKLHVAPHDGYLITKPREFVTRYASYLRTTLTVARAMLTVGGFVIPQLANMSRAVGNTLEPAFAKIKEADMTANFGAVEQVLNTTDSKSTYLGKTGTARGEAHETPIQGAELRELQSYLKVVDTQNSLGNLYRTVTDDGHVRWVCFQHYNSIGVNRMMSEYIRQFESFGGKFNEETNNAVVKVSLTTKNIDKLCDALTKGFNILSLTFENCSFNEKDLDKLLEIIINRSSIRRLVFSNVTVTVSQWLGVTKSEYTCTYISVHVNNMLLKVQFLEHVQDGDMKLFLRLRLQNKICRAFQIWGADFFEHDKDVRGCLQTKQQSNTLIMNYLNNIDFFYDILNEKFSFNHLKLSCWSSSPAILSRFCELLKRKSSLSELSIMDHHCFDDEDFTIQLLTTLHSHQSIRRLSLHVYRVEPSSRKETCLVDTLLCHSLLCRLHISESILSKKFIQALTYASKDTHSLNHLEFYDCQIDDDDVQSLQTLYTSGDLAYLTFSNEQYWSVTLAEIRQELLAGKYPHSQIFEHKSKKTCSPLL